MLLLSLSVVLCVGGALWALFTDSERQRDLAEGVLRLAMFPALFAVCVVLQYREDVQRRNSGDRRGSPMNPRRVGLLATRPGRLSLGCLVVGVAISIGGTVWMLKSWDEGSSPGRWLAYVGAAVIAAGIPLVSAHHRQSGS
ncbi:hypothetical protein [Streptomyces sp. T028]|uniref:hypothetical protein n=1 Tax=Streptomyces sp. T028 TaxID=3394379 RepID=UPI003A837E3F